MFCEMQSIPFGYREGNLNVNFAYSMVCDAKATDKSELFTSQTSLEPIFPPRRNETLAWAAWAALQSRYSFHGASDSRRSSRGPRKKDNDQ